MNKFHKQAHKANPLMNKFHKQAHKANPLMNKAFFGSVFGGPSRPGCSGIGPGTCALQSPYNPLTIPLQPPYNVFLGIS